MAPNLGIQDNRIIHGNREYDIAVLLKNSGYVCTTELSILHQHGLKLDYVTSGGLTALHLCVDAAVSATKYLIEHRVDPHATDKRGRSVLMTRLHQSAEDFEYLMKI